MFDNELVFKLKIGNVLKKNLIENFIAGLLV